MWELSVVDVNKQYKAQFKWFPRKFYYVDSRQFTASADILKIQVPSPIPIDVSSNFIYYYIFLYTYMTLSS